ncbi:MAG: VWA domain-containing protein, partial [Proteobacteria bacterium]|nr:VWA domain-containing protein [Pseudomonadota bacterium]
QTAKEVLADLLSDLPADTKVGLMAYGHRVKGDCRDVETLSRIGSEPPGALISKVNAITPQGKTPIAYSLQASAANFDGLEAANNNLVLISDGIESCDGDPCAEATALASMGIGVKVHVVGFDVTPEARKQLECIAENGNGKYFDAGDTTTFKQAMAEVQQVAQAAPEPEPAAPTITEVFRDDFDGEELSDAWEVLNPNPDAYIVEDGVLLMISGTSGTREALDFTNLFRLTEDMPKGDWVATAKLSIEFATGQEVVFLGVVDTQDDAIYTWVSAWRGKYKEGFSLTIIKRSKGQDTTSDRALRKSKNYKGRPAEETLSPDISQPIYLRLTKTGRSYVAGVKLGDDEEAQWIDTDKVTLLRAKGRLAIGTTQRKAVNGETLIMIDWVKIEVSTK